MKKDKGPGASSAELQGADSETKDVLADLGHLEEQKGGRKGVS